MVDQPAVGFELRFTRAAHADAAAELLEVGPHARESRQHVLELRELHLHLRFAVRARVAKMSRISSARSIDARADRVLDVLALAGRQLVVEDDERRLLRLDGLAQLLDLALAEVGARMRTVDLLRQFADDDRAGGVRELGELLGDARRAAGALAALERRAHEERPLCGRMNDRSELLEMALPYP